MERQSNCCTNWHGANAACQELARFREGLLEAYYNAFCSAVRLLPAEAEVHVPHLDDLLDFCLLESIGGEIVVISTPEETSCGP
ncbi:MAG: hypothetical protein M5U25_11445 [Planctomycetota bacterium]|nr:hypothetical protein [Planctomycetota bacterium]